MPKTTLLRDRITDRLDNVAYIKDVKAAGVQSGSLTSGGWRTRDVNTLQGNADFLSISGNQILIEPGEYEVFILVPGHQVDQHVGRLFNVDDSLEVLKGTSPRASSGDTTSTESIIIGKFSIQSQKAFEIQQYSATSKSSNGFGYASPVGESVFTQARITKLD